MTVTVILCYIIVVWPCVDGFGQACGKNYRACDIGDWLEWGECNQECGGGIRIRQKPICCNVNKVSTLDQCLNYCKINQDTFNHLTTETQPCAENCYNNGHFNKIANKCDCASGTWGRCCDEYFNECQSNPCKHGTCISRFKSYRCYCSPGYSGGTCEISACDSKLCANNGICQIQYVMQNGRPVYQAICNCTSDFFGDSCQYINKSSTTLYSTSISTIERKTTRPPPTLQVTTSKRTEITTTMTPPSTSMPTTMTTRSTSIPTTSARQSNTTTLRSTSTSLSVTTARQPSTTVNKPTIKMSAVFLTMTSLKASLYASSSPLPASAIIPSQGQHTLINGNPVKVYHHPEYVSDCGQSKCHNGTCIDFGSEYVCVCTTGYIGRHCEIDKDDCEGSPCFYGRCIDEVNNYTCECNIFFYGRNCTQMKLWGIIFISLASLGLLFLCSCCIWFIPSRMKRKKDEDKENVVDANQVSTVKRKMPPTKKPII